MRSGSVDTYLNRQAYCRLHFDGYKVNHTPNGDYYDRSFTRSTEDDIPEEFIDQSSVHFEAALNTSGLYEPGGVVPATIRCHVNGMYVWDDDGWREFGEGGGTVRNYKQIINPETALDYDVAYLPVVRIYSSSGFHTMSNLASHMIITQKEERDGCGYDLTFQTELCVFDNQEIDLSNYSTEGFLFRALSQAVVQKTNLGLGALQNRTNIYPGNMSNISGILTPRELLDRLLEISGCFLRQRDGVFYIVPVVSSIDEQGSPVVNWAINKDWVMDERYIGDGDIIGENYVGYVLMLDEQSSKPKNKDVHRYVCSGNPFVKSWNKAAIKTYVEDRFCSKAYNIGMEVTCLFNPKLEPGDFIGFDGTHLLTRIEWDGGAFCKLYGAKPNTGYVR